MTSREYLKTKSASDRQTIMMTENWLQSLLARPVLCIFWNPLDVGAYNLHQPDILHNIFIRMFNHHMTWIEDFLQHHGKAMVFDVL